MQDNEAITYMLHLKVGKKVLTKILPNKGQLKII